MQAPAPPGLEGGTYKPTKYIHSKTLMIQLKSLQQRLAVFLLFPVAVLMFAMGSIGFIYARNILLDQWKEAAILKLGRAAHQVDMRLGKPREWMEMLNHTLAGPDTGVLQQAIIQRLEQTPGVEQVRFRMFKNRINDPVDRDSPSPAPAAPRPGNTVRPPTVPTGRLNITPPRYDALLDHETVSLISDLIDKTGRPVGRLEVVLSFGYLIKNILTSSWWQGDKAFLVDDAGTVLTCTVPGGQMRFCETPLERKILAAMETIPYGTVLGTGIPPREVSGFYRLEAAPWSLVVVAPGKKILAPIVRFRTLYMITGIGFILFILILIRIVTHRTVSSIKKVSHAAENIARGRFGTPIEVDTRDEVGELTQSFNTMVQQLEERIRLKEAMNLAMEVQQNLLPPRSIEFGRLDIVGKTLYCDETGGDYFDLLQFPEMGRDRIGIAVGDVVGHGIAAALLMTTIRALLRSRITQSGSLSDIMSDVNRTLCRDTVPTDSFMTLFFMWIDASTKRMHWIRAGHEPAVLYHAASDSFDELKGDGIALGIDSTWRYQEYVHDACQSGNILLIGTDGIWETRNPAGDIFGKARLKDIIRRLHLHSAKDILDAVIQAIETFRETARQEDDVTLVILKIRDADQRG